MAEEVTADVVPKKVIELTDPYWRNKIERVMAKGHFGAHTPDYPLYRREIPIDPPKED